jgi:peptide-methionine (S)-S-oxide reductase
MTPSPSSKSIPVIAAAGAVLATLLLASAPAQALQTPETFKRLPAPAFAGVPPTAAGDETAYLAGGCFWGVQGVFAHVKGVKQ